MYSGKLSIPGKLSNELSYVFVDDEIEQQNGSITLFGMFDIKSGSELYHIIIKEAVKHFLDFYHRAQMDGGGFDEMSDSAEFIFENSIQYTYEKVSDALCDAQDTVTRGAQIEMRRVNCILGAFIDDTLFLSVTGTTLTPFLMYPAASSQGASRYSMINIIKTSGDAATDTNARLFSNIISGKISLPSSTVIICNQTLLDYIDPQHIKQIISNTPVASIIKNFHAILSKVNSRADFSALLFSNARGVEQNYSKTRSALSSESMQGLNGTEDRTHSILTPKVRPLLTKYSNKFLHSILALLRRVAVSCVRACQSLYSPERRSAAMALCRKLFARILAIIRRLPEFFSAGARFCASRVRTVRTVPIKDYGVLAKKVFSEKKHSLRSLFQNTVDRFSRLTPQSRLLLSLSALFILLFLISLVSIQLRRGAEQTDTRIREIIAGIEQKNDLIDASMIYDDRERARSLLDESHALLNLVGQKYRNRADFITAEKKLEALDMRLNNVTRLASLDVLATVPADASGATPALRAVASKTYVLAYSSDTIYLFDQKARTLNPLDGLRGKIPSISCAVAASDSVFYFCSGDGARVYSLTLPDQAVKSVSLPRHEQESSLDSVQIYNNRLYVLTKQSGHIFRHLSVATGFSRGVPWTRSSQEFLKGASSFTIDGKVYALGGDGNIRLYSTGTSEERSTGETVKNILAHGALLWTDPDDTLLYALVPTEKKLIAINKKTFDLTAQIVSDQFTNLQGFAVNRSKNEILILDAGRVIRVPFDVK